MATALLDEGREVVGIDSLNAYYDPALKLARLAQLAGRKGFRFYKLDLADREATDALFSGVRPATVIHLAAQAGVRYSLQAPHAYLDANLAGFLNVLEGCRTYKVDHLLYASSSSVYGASATAPFAETEAADRPQSLYAATKRANELMAESYAHLFAIPMTGMRFFTVYGPWGRPDMAYCRFTEAILQGRPIDVFNNGDMLRDFTWIGDCVEAILRLMQRHANGHAIYNIGNSQPVSLERFILAIETATGRLAIRNPMPMQPGDVPVTCADTSKLMSATGFAPATPIEDGITKFVAWYREHYKADALAA